MKNLVILQGDSHASNETYSGEYNNSGDSDVLLGESVYSGDPGEYEKSCYPTG